MVSWEESSFDNISQIFNRLRNPTIRKNGIIQSFCKYFILSENGLEYQQQEKICRLLRF